MHSVLTCIPKSPKLTNQEVLTGLNRWNHTKTVLKSSSNKLSSKPVIMKHQGIIKVTWNNYMMTQSVIWMTVIMNMSTTKISTITNKVNNMRKDHLFRRVTIIQNNHQTTSTTTETRRLLSQILAAQILAAQILAVSIMIRFKIHEDP